MRKIKNNKWTEQEILILKDNYKFGSRHCMSLLKDRNISDISYKAAYLGLKLTKEEKYQIHCKARVKHFNEYSVDPNQFLKIETPEVAYILGFIWADGCISKFKYQIRLGIQKQDADQITHVFNKTGKWNIHNQKHDRWKDSKTFYVGNKIIWSFLNENDYRIKSGASADKILGQIPEHLKHYWWRGYFDGDGCLFFKPQKSNTLTISSVYNQDWNFCLDLCKKLNINKYNINVRDKNIKSRSSNFVIQNAKDIAKFCDYIYQNKEKDNIGLDRKYQKYLLIKKYLQDLTTTNNLIEINNLNIYNDEYRRGKILELIKVNNGKVKIDFIFSLFKTIPKQKLYVDLDFLKRNNKVYSRRIYLSSIYYLKHGKNSVLEEIN